ncbi:MAG: hypothetical protein JJT81_08905 [Rubellimicrobium sp.]|nr:hypothetical protein [Rubellimicrobium sp.]
MNRILPLVAAVGLLAACGDGQPFFNEDEIPGGGDGDGGSIAGPDLPPGTAEPTASRGILRFEATDDQGGGFVRDVAYDARTDQFFVDNLAFDGANIYSRGEAVSSMGGFAVYESNPTAFDAVTGRPVEQLQYRTIYGVSRNTTVVNGERVPVSQFAIVRTGSYVGYGFGGFVYERSGGVNLPTTGFATYDGTYAGQRVFDGAAGQEFTRGDVNISIDFEDFNDGAGVRGTITNREAFDIDGNAIPLGGEGELVLPTLRFVIGPGALTPNGEISAGIQSLTVNDDGSVRPYEEGMYYAIIGGQDASEIVGVFVVESQDPRFSGVTAQETGGFIVYR